MEQQQKWTLRNFVWIFIACIAEFILIASIWIRRTYGVLCFAMANASFLNFLKNKRRLFLYYVFIPTICTFFILIIFQIIIERKKHCFSNRKLLYTSLTLLIVCSLGASMCLDTGTYLSRQYRLSRTQWYDTDKIIAHALGAIDGVAYTNSKEALENSYQNGVRYLECDFSITADHQLVACHDWDFWYSWEHDTENTDEKYVPDFEEFMTTKVRTRFTALSGEELMLFMKQHPDIYIITDTKDSSPATLGESFKALVELSQKNECEDVLDRFIIQIYNLDMYEIVQEIYPFPNYILTLYQLGFNGEENRMEGFAKFCMLHDIDVITMGGYLYSDKLLEIADRYGLQIFVHTINDEDEIKAFIDKGVGVYTDKTEFDF